MYKLYYKFKEKFKLEKDFTTAFLKEFKNQGGWAFKISDAIRTIKPFDFIGINEDGLYLCEVKKIEGNVFNFSQIRDNQFTALSRINEIVKKYNLPKIYPIIIIHSIKFSNYKVIDFNDILEAMEKGKTNFNLLF